METILLMLVVTLVQIGVYLLYRPEEVNVQAFLLPDLVPEGEAEVNPDKIEDRPSVLYGYHTKVALVRLLALLLGGIAIAPTLATIPLQVALGFFWERTLSHRVFRLNGQEGPISLWLRLQARQIEFSTFIVEFVSVEGRTQMQRAGFIVLSSLLWSLVQGSLMWLLS
jgi:hypothetical protein